MAFFDIYGPYDIAFEGSGGNRHCVSKQSELLDGVESDCEGLSAAIGCYLFGTRHGNVVTPWYVGKTVNSFAQEVFQRHKLTIFRQCLKRSHGRPVLFLFPLYTATDRFARGKTHDRTVSWVEKMLMGLAFRQNAEIANIRSMAHHRGVQIYGLVGDPRAGRQYNGVAMARRALFGAR